MVLWVRGEHWWVIMSLYTVCKSLFRLYESIRWHKNERGSHFTRRQKERLGLIKCSLRDTTTHNETKQMEFVNNEWRLTTQQDGFGEWTTHDWICKRVSVKSRTTTSIRHFIVLSWEKTEVGTIFDSVVSFESE